ncbi:hypothetical protein R3P38DRAFT_2779643 [Favolaschia claudopus]|uniref:Nucleoplasmin-like domain-containing protein n=1 Tax=Favolaschia claudopus TaxID=2862362 RepID=A0AAW0BCJ2_9AGAR
MAREENSAQWACRILPGEFYEWTLDSRGVFVTNVFLDSKLQGDFRTILLITHVNADPTGEPDLTVDAAVACLIPNKVENVTVNLFLNPGEHILFRTQGNKYHADPCILLVTNSSIFRRQQSLEVRWKYGRNNLCCPLPVAGEQHRFAPQLAESQSFKYTNNVLTFDGESLQCGLLTGDD